MTTLAQSIETHTDWPARLLPQAPKWLAEFRADSWQQALNQQPPRFPKIDYRDWPLFDLKAIPPHIDVPGNLVRKAQAVVTLGRKTIKIDLPADLIAQGVVVCDLEEAMTTRAALFEKHFRKCFSNKDQDGLALWDAALVNSGLFIYIPKNVHLSSALKILQLQDSRQEENFINLMIIVLETGAQAEISQEVSTLGDCANAADLRTVIFADADSTLTYTVLDTLSAKTSAHIYRKSQLDQDARVQSTFVEMNQGNVVSEFYSDLLGSGSNAETKVVAITAGKQTQGINTKITNYARHSVGNIVQHGVLLDESKLVFNGIGRIIKGAHAAYSQQENRLLMLSEFVQGDANPILLIDENDVIAGHAASIGQVDRQQLYYLLSRGLTKSKAQSLLVKGFLAESLSEISDKAIADYAIFLIERSLFNG
ncbi:MAG: SufD family Fe-S cluster assembly protein [Oenococcus sp.]|uniref:SufB/SufD family protein n=1 Tax=Oenococcus sp. TaxID=1979414 RepID=UPI0039EB10F7